jgi:flagellar hook assembly protein FlgD
MKYGAGQIFAQTGKLSIGADKDGNGVMEMTACFAKADLRTLFAGLPKGTNTVTVTLEGDVSTGGKFRTTLTIDVVGTGGALASSLSPNPLNPEATLTFTTSLPGRVKASVFDLHGRLVRALETGVYLGAGYHDLHVDGRGDRGERLPSGVYYYRIETGEGEATGRFVIAR